MFKYYDIPNSFTIEGRYFFFNILKKYKILFIFIKINLKKSGMEYFFF